MLLVLAVAVAVVLKSFVVQAFFIPSASMHPGLVEHDRILVEKVSYWGGGTPRRGDVVVFDDPDHWLGPGQDRPGGALGSTLTTLGLRAGGGHLVKRVIGVAGDVVTCCDAQGRISVNGTPLDERDYIVRQPDCNGPMIRSCHWTAGPVPPGSLFVMGDNRGDSADSTVHLCTGDVVGCDPDSAYVPTHLVVGKVIAVVWPLSHLRAVRRPATFARVADAG